MTAFRCGDVVWADLDPSAGHEQNKRRPLIIVSNDKFNARCSLTMAVPITSTDSGYPLHIPVGTVPDEEAPTPSRVSPRWSSSNRSTFALATPFS